MLKYHYVYEIVNSKENKSYIGSRTTKKVPELDTQYWSSSDLVKALVKEHPEDFIKIILCKFTTRKRAVAFEIFLHNYFDVARNPAYYNKAKQTSTKFDTTGNKEVALKISERMKGKPSPFKDKKHSEEAKTKNSIAHKGNVSPMKDKKHTEASRAKMSIAQKGRVPSEEHRKALSEYWTGRARGPWSEERRAEYSQLLKESGARKGSNNSRYVKLDNSLIYDMVVNQKLSYCEVAKVLGSNYNTIRRHFEAYGK